MTERKQVASTVERNFVCFNVLLSNHLEGTNIFATELLCDKFHIITTDYKS